MKTVAFAEKHAGKKYFFTLLAALTVLAGALYASPEWVSGKSRRYPDDKFIAGVGSGRSMDAARDAARAEIAKVFKVAVEQVTVETATERSRRETSRGVRTVSTSDVEQKTVARVADTVEGVEIAQVWYDKKDKVYWALAVLDKAKYRRELSAGITDSEEKVMRSLEAARASESYVEKLKNLSEARSSAVARDALYSRRRIVDDFPAAELPDDLSVTSIESEMSAARAMAFFRLSPADATSAELAAVLSDKLASLGFAVDVPDVSGAPADGNSAAVTVEVSFEVTPFSRGQSDWKYYRWAGRFDVKDSGKVVITAAASGSESNPDDSAASKKARLAGLKILGDLFERKIKNDFLGGE